MHPSKLIPSLAILGIALLAVTFAWAQTPVGPQGATTHDLARFAGPWVAHGAGLRVDLRTRMAYLDERTYTWCGPRVSAPCDQINGNRIVPGLRLALRIRAVQGDTAEGVVARSTDAHGLPVGAHVGMRLLPHGRLILDDHRFVLDSRTMCNERYFTVHLAEYERWWNCGA
jgi:hypothetical protein